MNDENADDSAFKHVRHKKKLILEKMVSENGKQMYYENAKRKDRFKWSINIIA